jgi:predicted permease
VNRALRWLALLAPAVGAAGTIGFMLFAGDFSTTGNWLFFTGLSAWSAAPYAAMAFVGRAFGAERVPLAIVTGGAVLLVGFAGWVLLSAFFLHPDAQSGLVFLFLPLWQAVLFLPVLLVAWGWRRLRQVSAG